MGARTPDSSAALPTGPASQPPPAPAIAIAATLAAETASDAAAEIDAIARIDAVPVLLQVLCQITGMGFAAVARVTEGRWMACAVHDEIAFGLQPGGQLDVHTTLCKEVRASRRPVVIEHASQDPQYCGHPTPRLYAIESYVSVPIVTGDGEYFGNLCAIDPRPMKLSEPRTVVTFELMARLVARELDAQRHREQAQKALLDERELGELREQFIAVLGHDLRNPLNAVSACAHLLRLKAAEPETVRSLAARITTSVGRMGRLIDDVLDFARGRLGGGLQLGAELVSDLGPAIEQVASELRDGQPERPIVTRIAIDRPVRCDRGRIQQLVSNLLANALQHGAPGGPIGLTAGIEGEALVITVHNDGAPIPPAALGQIFSPFWRGQVSSSRQGLGLGLHICAQIVKAHGGTLVVSSTCEAGTVFTARLPAGS